MEDNTEEEKEKIEFIKKNIIEKGIDPRIILNFLNSKNSLGKKNINDMSLSELNNIINIISNTNDEDEDDNDDEKKLEEKKESTNLNLKNNEIDNKKKEKEKEKILKKENDERFGVIIPEFIECQKIENSCLSKYEKVEAKIEGYNIVEKGIFNSGYIIYEIKTIPLNLKVKRKYKDFVWLREKMKLIYKTSIIPNIKGTEESFGETEEEKSEKEKKNLERFLNFLLNDPLIKTSNILYDFLSIEKGNDFIKKKKTYENLKPFDEISHFKSLNGKARICFNDKKEKYFDNINESIELNENILNKISENFVLLKIKMVEVIDRVLSFVPLFESLINLGEKFGDHWINIESYKQIKLIFEAWIKVLKKQDSFFFYEIYDYMNFILGNLNYMKELVQNTKNMQYNYYESSQNLLSKKRELFKRQDTLKWNLCFDDTLDLPSYKKNKTIAYKKINFDETKEVINQKQKYGFYLNRLISEYERLKYFYAKRNKDIITSFALSQQKIFVDSNIKMGEIVEKMDICEIPENYDYEEIFEYNNKNIIKEDGKKNKTKINSK